MSDKPKQKKRYVQISKEVAESLDTIAMEICNNAYTVSPRPSRSTIVEAFIEGYMKSNIEHDVMFNGDVSLDSISWCVEYAFDKYNETVIDDNKMDSDDLKWRFNKI